MAFGTITVRSESGELQEFSLDKPVTSVGRQPGNDIVLHTSAVSRYHAQFAVAEGRVFVVDLGTINGTFVNDRQLDPNARLPLSDGDQIQIGDRLLTFRLPESRHRQDISLTPTALMVAEEGLPFRIVLDKPHQAVAPGARMQLILVVENLSTAELVLSADVTGLEPGWVRLSRRELLLDPEEHVELLIAVLPPRSSATRPGRYALTVRVAQADDPNRGLDVVREIDVVGYSELAVAVEPAPRAGSYTVRVANNGNIQLGLDLRGYDAGGQLRYRFEPAALVLAPGATGTSSLGVTRADRRAADEAPVTFAVVARSHGAPGFAAPVVSRYVPPRHTGMPPLAAAFAGLVGGLLLLAVVVATISLLDLWPGSSTDLTPAPTLATPAASEAAPTPTLVQVPTGTVAGSNVITRFSVSDSELRYRSSRVVTLNWAIAAEAAGEAIRLEERVGEVEREVVLDAAAQRAGSLSLPAYAFDPGIHNFRLVVGPPGGETDQSLAGVSVLTTTCQVLDPATVVRTAPDDAAPPAEPSLLLSLVVLAGRSADAEWAYVAYNDPEGLETLGWVPAGEIACPPGVQLADYVVVDDAGEIVRQSGMPDPPQFLPAEPTPTPTLFVPSATPAPATGAALTTTPEGVTPTP